MTGSRQGMSVQHRSDCLPIQTPGAKPCGLTLERRFDRRDVDPCYFHHGFERTLERRPTVQAETRDAEHRELDAQDIALFAGG